MTQTTSPDNSSTKSNLGFFSKMRNKLANSFLNSLYGRDMHFSSNAPTVVAGAIVFWYVENGVRHFVMVKDLNDSGEARFVSCLGIGKHHDINTATVDCINTLLGKVFYRSVDKKLITNDRVVSVPSFTSIDEVTGNNTPVTAVVWTVQITPEQAQMCEPVANNIDVIAVPEFGIIGSDVAHSHQLIYQSVLRHIQETSPIPMMGDMDALDDLFKNSQVSHRTIH